MFDSPTDNSEWFSAGSFTNDDCGPASATSTTNENATEQVIILLPRRFFLF